MSPGRPKSVPNLGPELEPHSRYSGRQQTDSGIAAVTRPVAALQPRVSAEERCRSLYFRCRKQQKQLAGWTGVRRAGTGLREEAVEIVAQPIIAADDRQEPGVAG